MLVRQRQEVQEVSLGEGTAGLAEVRLLCPRRRRFGLIRAGDSLALEDYDFGKNAVARLELFGARAIHPAVAYGECIAEIGRAHV